MTPIRLVAAAQLATGWLLARDARRSLRLLGYPDDQPLAQATVRVLGARQVAQGAVELRGDPTTMRVGAGIDVVHALTCLAYAHRSKTGRRAGLRSAGLALAFAAAQVAAASRGAGSTQRDEPRRAPRAHPGPATTADLPRVGSASATAWPEPSEHDQQVLVEETAQERVVALRGGVMDGATVAVAPGTRHYDVIDSDRGPQRYVETADVDDAGLVVFEREADRPA